MRTVAWCLCVFCVAVLLFLGTFIVVRGYLFDRDCGDYLKLAADAPTVERADGFLSKAIAYLDRTGRTAGNSAIIFKTPENDVGIWYGQLKAAHETTITILAKKPDATQLERDNALMKIRETLLDQGETGTVVTAPAHISIVPYQVAIAVLFWLLLALVILDGVLFWRSDY